MWNLIHKDYYAHWQHLLAGSTILFVVSSLYVYTMLLGGGRADPDLIIYFLIVVLSSAFFSLLFMKMDELYRADVFFVSLPTSRKQVVLARYLSSFGCLFLALLSHFLGVKFGSWVYGTAGQGVLAITGHLSTWLIVFIVCLLFKSYSYPLYSKFGLSKGVAVYIGIQFLLLVAIILSHRAFNLFEPIQYALEWISANGSIWILLGLCLLLMFFLMCSVRISMWFYENKDL